MRAMVVIAGGMLGTVAVAAAPEVRSVADLDAEATTISVAQLDGAARLVVTGPSKTWLVEPTTGETLATLPRGFRGAVIREGGPLFGCAEDGLFRVSLGAAELGTPELVDPKVCSQVGLLSGHAGVSVVAIGQAIRVFPLGDDQTLGQVQVVEAPVDAPVLLAVDKRRFAVASLGGEAVYEEGPWGTSALRTGGAIGGLTAGPSAWVWSLPAENALVDVTRTRIAVAPGPGAVLGADLDGDRIKEILVAHPEEDRLGVLRGTTETLLDDVSAPRHMVSADLDEDGCDEVAMLAGGRLYVLSGTCIASGGAVAEGTAGSGSAPRRPEVTIGGVRTTLSARVGDTLELQLVDVQGRATAWSASGGPPTLKVSSTGRLTYPVEPGDVGRWQVRVMRWVDGSWIEGSGIELQVMPVTALAVGPRDNTSSRYQTDLTEALEEDVGSLRRSLPFRGCTLGVGGVVGGSRVRASWVLLGQGFLAAGSPAVSIACDGGQEKGVWWTAGLDTAPWFTYVVGERAVRHGLTSTVGVGWTNSTWSVGAFGTTGVTMLGLGPMARFQPFEQRSGARHGPEVRFTWLPNGDLTFEGSVYYTFQLGAYR